MTTDHVKLLAEVLAHSGVSAAFGVTGSGHSLQLIEELQYQRVPYYGVGHECAAALMAGAAGRGGSIGAVAISIKGPGLSNMIPGILSNYYEGRPTVTISECYAADAPTNRKHKRLDHRLLTSSITKGYLRVGDKKDTILRLLKDAEEGFPGPVHIDLSPVPEKETKVLCDRNTDGHPASLTAPVGALNAVREAKRPCVVLGSQARRRMHHVDWNALKVPVVTTAAAKGSINEHNPWFAGIVTGEINALSPEKNILSESDLILGFGMRAEELVKPITVDVPLLTVDDMCEDLGSDSTLLNLFDELYKSDWGDEIVRDYRERVEQHVLNNEWLPGPILRRLCRYFDCSSAVLVPDTGFFCTVAETVWRVSNPEEFCGSCIGRFMGTAIPTAVGISITEAKRKVICVLGDGGISPYFGEIRLAITHELPILFLLLSDSRYSSVAAFAQCSRGSRPAVETGSANWWQAANALGCDSCLVESFSKLDQVLDSWDCQGPFFVQANIDPERHTQIAMQLR